MFEFTAINEEEKRDWFSELSKQYKLDRSFRKGRYRKHTLPGTFYEISEVCASNDGRIVFGSKRFSQVWLYKYDIEYVSIELVNTLSCLDVDWDSNILVAGSYRRQLEVLSLETFERLALVELHLNAVKKVRISGKEIYSTGVDLMIRKCKLIAGGSERIFDIQVPKEVADMCVNVSFLVAGFGNGDVVVYCKVTGNMLVSSSLSTCITKLGFLYTPPDSSPTLIAATRYTVFKIMILDRSHTRVTDFVELRIEKRLGSLQNLSMNSRFIAICDNVTILVYDRNLEFQWSSTIDKILGESPNLSLMTLTADELILLADKPRALDFPQSFTKLKFESTE
ncbi:hypothetical protein HK098_007642 [Nowakowskiella sp. JEL0407]|nr:hypothetical protein HK098_007642 [Nowakowskiella sp. JEL0407]